MSIQSTGNLDRRAASQGAQLDVTADTGHSGQMSSMVLNQSRGINAWEKYSSLYNVQWAGLGNSKRPTPLWHLPCAGWVWCVDRWSAVTVAFDTLQLCADVNAFTRHEALWWCPEQAVGVYSLIVLNLHWNCSRDLLLNQQHRSVRAGLGWTSLWCIIPAQRRMQCSCWWWKT